MELQNYFNQLREKQSEGGIGFMGMYSMFTGGGLGAVLHWRSGHHALHKCYDYSAVDEPDNP